MLADGRAAGLDAHDAGAGPALSTAAALRAARVAHSWTSGRAAALPLRVRAGGGWCLGLRRVLRPWLRGGASARTPAGACRCRTRTAGRRRTIRRVMICVRALVWFGVFTAGPGLSDLVGLISCADPRVLRQAAEIPWRASSARVAACCAKPLRRRDLRTSGGAARTVARRGFARLARSLCDSRAGFCRIPARGPVEAAPFDNGAIRGIPSWR